MSATHIKVATILSPEGEPHIVIPVKNAIEWLNSILESYKDDCPHSSITGIEDNKKDLPKTTIKKSIQKLNKEKQKQQKAFVKEYAKIKNKTTAKKFCEEKQIKLTSLYAWIKKYSTKK